MLHNDMNLFVDAAGKEKGFKHCKETCRDGEEKEDAVPVEEFELL
jgi:hypothetical protein